MISTQEFEENKEYRHKILINLTTNVATKTFDKVANSVTLRTTATGQNCTHEETRSR
jgi:hypothetical protein